MKPCLITLFIAALACGCSTQRSVIAFSPRESWRPQTGAELLKELNAELPFKVGPKQFLCKVQSGEFVGWVVVNAEEQKATVKSTLKQSQHLQLLQVGELSPEFKKTLKQNWKASLKVTAPAGATSKRKPAWSSLLPPELTNESARRMDTQSLARACLSTGILTRLMLSYNTPDDALNRAQGDYPGFAELFSRDDLWKAMLANLDAGAAEMRGEDAAVTSMTMMNPLMSLTTMNSLYSTDVMRLRLRGHEKDFIRAHLDALKALRIYSERFQAQGRTASTPFPPEMAAGALAYATTTLIGMVSPADGARIRQELAEARMRGGAATQDGKGWLELAIREIEEFYTDGHS